MALQRGVEERPRMNYRFEKATTFGHFVDSGDQVGRPPGVGQPRRGK